MTSGGFEVGGAKSDVEVFVVLSTAAGVAPYMSILHPLGPRFIRRAYTNWSSMAPIEKLERGAWFLRR